MKFFQRSSLTVVLVALVALASVVSSTSVQAGQVPSSPQQENNLTVTNGASLHNPGFDNHIWYWFHERYGYATNLIPDSFVPDDDVADGPQQWKLWYLDGTVPIVTRVTSVHYDGKESLRGHTYWDGKHLAGAYQTVYDTTPCFTYRFQMYGQSRPGEDSDNVIAMQVGIDRVGFVPDTWAVEEFPNSTTWGTAHNDYHKSWGLLTVTAEAWADQITVYTYADVDGGSSHDILWDGGSFQEIPETQLIDPNDPPEPTPTLNPTADAASTVATISWTSSNTALSQVYYRRGGSSSGSPPGTLLANVLYLPAITRGPNAWSMTELDTSGDTSIVLTGLQPGTSYEYILAYRGVSGAGCVTVVSDIEQFVTD